jgi:ABC-type phosphate transport system substrate-binding protein
MSRRLLTAVVLVAALLGPRPAPGVGAPPTPALVTDFVVIVHPDNPTRSLPRSFVRGAYLKQIVEWGGGAALHPVDLPLRSPTRDRFTRAILRKTPAQLRAFWHQQIFTGKGVPPPVVASPADAIAYVLAHRGAVAYLPIGVDPGRARVVRLE